MAAKRTPPRRGVSVVWAAADAAGATTSMAGAGPLTSSDCRRRAWLPAGRPTNAATGSRSDASILGQPDVLELLVRLGTGRRDVVLHLGPVHDVARPPETRDVVHVL